MKKPPSEWGEMFANKAADKGFIFKIYKQFMQLSIKKQRHYFADKGPSSQSYDFSSSYAWM